MGTTRGYRPDGNPETLHHVVEKKEAINANYFAIKEVSMCGEPPISSCSSPDLPVGWAWRESSSTRTGGA
jgi:hypothetical protein